MGFLSKLAYGSDMKNRAIGEAYTRLIEFFSAQGSLAGRFKVRPCFYPPFSRRSCLCLAYRLENRQNLGRTDRPVRTIQCSCRAVLPVDRLLAYVFTAWSRTARSLGATDWKSVLQRVRRTSSPSYKAYRWINGRDGLEVRRTRRSKRKLAAKPQATAFLRVQTSDSTKDSIEFKLPEAGQRLEAIGLRYHLPLTPYVALRAFRRVGCASKFGDLRTPAVLLPPSGLDECQSVWIDLCVLH